MLTYTYCLQPNILWSVLKDQAFPWKSDQRIFGCRHLFLLTFELQSPFHLPKTKHRDGIAGRGAERVVI